MKIYIIRVLGLIAVIGCVLLNACEPVKEGDPRLIEYKNAVKKGEQRTDWVNKANANNTAKDKATVGNEDNKDVDKTATKNQQIDANTKNDSRATNTNQTNASTQKSDNSNSNITNNTDQNNRTIINNKSIQEKETTKPKKLILNDSALPLDGESDIPSNTELNKADSKAVVKNKVNATANEVEQQKDNAAEKTSKAVNNNKRKLNNSVADSLSTNSNSANEKVKEKIEATDSLTAAKPDSLKKIQLKKAGIKAKELLNKTGKAIKNTGDKVKNGVQNLTEKEEE